MKNTPFYSFHESLGAKIVEFAGYAMPISYTSINEEHETVRTRVGVFDVSHMGEFLIEGDDAFNLVQKVTSNDISKIVAGQAQYNCMPNETGGIVDDLIVYKFSERKFLLVVNASNIDKDWEWITKHNDAGVSMKNISDDMGLLAVQGPKASKTLQKLTGIDLDDIPFYHFKQGEMAGVKDVIISATGYTGSGGFELYFDKADAETIWLAIMEAGEEYNITAVGLAARDTLRLEMAYCLYGNDINDQTSPLEAGLGWITKFREGNNFINHENLKAQKEKGITNRLIGFEMIDRGIPRQGYEIKNEQGETIGKVTSGTQSPSLKKAIGLGYVPIEKSKPGNEIYIAIRKKTLKAEVVKTPFYQPG